MKVAILQDDFPPESLGGAGVVANNLASSLREKGCDVFVITSTQKDDFIEEKDGIRIFRLKNKPFGFFKYYLCLYNPWIVNKVRRILDKEMPDIVHCHNLHTALSYYCLKLARKFSKKVFLTAHDTMLVTYGKLATKNYIEKFDYRVSVREQIIQAGKQYNPFRNFLIRKYLKNVDKIFAVSVSLKKALFQNGIDNAEVIYNGIMADEFQANEKEIAEFKIRHQLRGKKIFFCGGRISRPKGGDKILEALKVILEKISKETVLMIAAPRNDYIIFFEKLCADSGIQRNVLFLGSVPHGQMRIVYGASDVVVYPSIYLDPFGLINIEAMAAKKPVVGTCFGGTPEIILDGKTGYIVNPFNIKSMSQRVIELLKNKELAQKMGEEGCQRVKDFFSLDKQVNTILKWYESK